jgi:hypothetical protein
MINGLKETAGFDGVLISFPEQKLGNDSEWISCSVKKIAVCL